MSANNLSIQKLNRISVTMGKRTIILSGMTLLLMLTLSASSFAGFVGPGAISTVITDIKSIDRDGRDDTNVLLEGHIIRQLSEEYYIFKDETDEIEVEIDYGSFRGKTVTPQTRIRISGTVDKGLLKTSVDVYYLEIIE